MIRYVSGHTIVKNFHLFENIVSLIYFRLAESWPSARLTVSIEKKTAAATDSYKGIFEYCVLGYKF